MHAHAVRPTISSISHASYTPSSQECKRRYSVKLWRALTDTFNCLPVSAVVDDKILCMHGGLSPELTDLG